MLTNTVEVPHLNAKKVLDAMMHDESAGSGRLSFVLPSRLGQVELVGNIAPADVRAALKNK